MFPLDSPTTAVPFNSALVTPNLPPMAEVRERNSHLIPSASAAARRSSMNSMMSNGSDDNSQYLLAPDVNRIGQEVSTPMSVRPFSPSESFAFPKPPSQSGDAGPLSSDSASFSPRMLSPKTSESTLVHPMNSQPYAMPAAVSIPTLTRQTPSPTEPTPASNPFADPHSQPDPVAAAAEFAAIETICRPFAPTLEDELRVSPGDSVRILKVFDDGWTFVERVGSNEDGAKGLIPVDCLREAGQALPAFLAQKRVSSYAGDKYNYEEMLSNMLEHGTAT
ncbi:hypothetical protein SERLA73DRAFT_188886 [Serpula lacrymans var. lacrymans S7.3]|uniref:SH3 domain-containing protein n=2 Tax=Serpula lacrymans var. lacrymans TaxID=341189 RepID=F8QD36_SERL3|nr:uncharacterized protein SERLADRAFT_479494 [Serpula lacrymans var. lacrymans S7.9]EGN93782.1 hypothetical protein SERLA73DRAFT_188886 [Serpula lacrymans var. lacrymans S7.3]EGO19156.1 hypothetical protein SERLADRAFT_479494 [Serpula lacrymans var. lacrymans S7.9]